MRAAHTAGERDRSTWAAVGRHLSARAERKGVAFPVKVSSSEASQTVAAL